MPGARSTSSSTTRATRWTRPTASKDESNVAEIGGEKVQLGIPDQLRGMAAMLIPLGRAGTPEEAAGGVFFLCSPWSNFVHGQVLNITGGWFTGITHPGNVGSETQTIASSGSPSSAHVSGMNP